MPTSDEKLGRSLKWTLVFFILFLVLLAVASARELPEIVEPSELSESWDGRRVMISGYARECRMYDGRMGSKFIKCVVEGIDVYMDFMIYSVAGERVIVIGEYKTHGRFGGLMASHFIIADTFIRDWE